jgi:hypothetical protein
MRYIHRRADEICAYIRSADLRVTKCSYDGSSAPAVATPNTVEGMLKQSETLWGLALPFYICATKSIEAKTLPLSDAVSRVEAYPACDEFLLIAYQDGGVISISGTKLAFQEQAEPADWWQP